MKTKILVLFVFVSMLLINNISKAQDDAPPLIVFVYANGNCNNLQGSGARVVVTNDNSPYNTFFDGYTNSSSYITTVVPAYSHYSIHASYGSHDGWHCGLVMPISTHIEYVCLEDNVCELLIHILYDYI